MYKRSQLIINFIYKLMIVFILLIINGVNSYSMAEDFFYKKYGENQIIRGDIKKDTDIRDWSYSVGCTFKHFKIKKPHIFYDVSTVENVWDNYSQLERIDNIGFFVKEFLVVDGRQVLKGNIVNMKGRYFMKPRFLTVQGQTPSYFYVLPEEWDCSLGSF